MTDTLDHALVGDGRIIALVAPDTGVEWLCLPRFDSPSVFGAILDRERGGVFRIEGGRPVDRFYSPDLGVLTTVLEVPGGQAVVQDLAWEGYFARRVSGSVGSVRVVFDPRPDYGRVSPTVIRTASGLQIGDELWLHTTAADALLAGAPIALRDGHAFVLGPAAPRSFEALDRARVAQRDPRFDHHPLRIRRAAQVLAAHTYGPTGAIIAAATTSIPEAIGAPRTWDYRYCWIRDGAFAAQALLRLGDLNTADRFLDFLQATLGDDLPQPLYGIDGRRDLPETTLDHLRGFADTGPVRIGNAAAQQTQNDSYGQIVWLGHALAEHAPPSPARYAWLARQADRAQAVGEAPDCGIWEFRDRPGRYTFSQLWRWIALDRMAALGAARGDARAAGWRAGADAVRAAILAAADRVGFFAQTLDCAVVDASSLTVAAMGLVPADDPRFRATIARCEAVLEADGLMRRYVEVDDFGETTSTFGLCTLWWAEALALAGERARASAVLERFCAHANPLGFFAEDIEPRTGRLLGNFPQVYSHTGVINATLALAAAPR